MHHKHLIPMALALGTYAVAMPAAASCGSAFCVLNTQWDTQGLHSEPGRLRLDLRYEYVKQDQLREGTENISIDQVTDEEAAELQTINRNWVATIDYSINDRWSVSAAIPVVKRRHSHIEDPAGAAEFESWDFTRAGDARILGRYKLESARPTDSVGLQFGAKLPTGSHTIANADGKPAERSLQPGSGSTDLVVGGFYAYRPQTRGLGGFAQVLFQKAVETKDEFRPGDQLTVTGGLSYPVSDAATLLFQVNFQRKGRDTGENAEPDVSGGRFVFASPGVSYSLTPDTQVYGFVQLPLMRDVNGIQLVADRALVAGLTTRF